jgi:Spy/CpxP family protein refolding chaperone
MEQRRIDANRKRAADARSDRSADGFVQRSGLYLMAAALLLVLGATLVAATQVDASSWLRGHDEQSRHERISARVEFATDWILDRIDATEDQSKAIQQIVADSLERFHTLHEANEDSHERLAALLTGATVDPEAVEAFRSEQMQKVEIASLQLTETLVAIAAELTPEQRAELVELAERHRGHGRHGHRGHGPFHD